MKWKNKGHEFDEVAKDILDDNAKYYLWGAGVNGLNFYKTMQVELKILGMIDADKTKIGEIIDGVEIISPNVIKNKSNDNIKVIITCSWVFEIYPILKKNGYIENKDFFHHQDFMSIYSIYRYNKLNISSLQYQVTQRCSLKCKHCSALIPYIEKPKNIHVDNIMDDLDKLFNIVNNINVFILVGGDAFMHNDLNEIVRKIGEKYYGTRISNILVLTNAVIMPTLETIQLFKEYSVGIRFSDYGKECRSKQRISEFGNLLKQNDILFQKIEYVNWVDIGYPQKSNNIKNLNTFFDMCFIKGCSMLRDGKVFSCAEILPYNDTKNCEYLKSDYFDIKTNLNSKELMEYLLGYSEKGYFECCKICNGLFTVNKKEIPAGEQL